MPLPHGVTELEVPQAGDGVRVFQSDLEALPPAATLLAQLEESERARAAGLVGKEARDGFIRRRWVRRALLAGMHGVDPSTMEIQSDRLGRPSIVSPAAMRSISLSTSSAGCYALIAWSGTRPVGVDIARVDGAHVSDGAARLFMAVRERDAWLASGCSPHVFFRVWARKEAVLKLRGTGFATDPTSVDVLEGSSVRGPVILDIPLRDAPGWIAAMAQ